MTGLRRRMTEGAVAVLVVLATATFGQVASFTEAGAQGPVERAALPPGSINNILVIELENEDASTTFGPGSPATYLNRHAGPRGRAAPRTTTPSVTSAWTTTSRRSPARPRHP